MDQSFQPQLNATNLQIYRDQPPTATQRIHHKNKTILDELKSKIPIYAVPPILSNDAQTRNNLASSFTNDENILSGSFKTKHDNYSKL